MGVLAVEDTLEKAIHAAYEKVKQVHFKNAYYRQDIGLHALKAEKES